MSRSKEQWLDLTGGMSSPGTGPHGMAARATLAVELQETISSGKLKGAELARAVFRLRALNGVREDCESWDFSHDMESDD